MSLPERGIEAREGLEFDKFIESTDNPGQFCVAIAAADGGSNFATTPAQSARTTGTITANGQTVGLDIEAYSIVTITVSGTYAGLTFIFEASPDNVTYYTIVGVDSAVLGSSATSVSPGTNGTKMYNVTLPGVTKFRIRATAFGSGTANIGLIATSDPMVFNVTASLGAGTNSIGNIGTVTPGTAATALGKAVDAVAGATDTGVSLLAVRQDNPTTITPANGDYTRILVDSQGSQWVRISTFPNANYNKSNITTATTSTPKSGVGFLHGIMINTPVASGVITIYDNTAASGTIIGTITFPATLLSSGPEPVIYNVIINTGVTIVTSAAFNLTVMYQ